MTISNGSVANADEVMNAYGSNFNDIAQMIFNSDYLGFDSRLTNIGTPNLKNVFYSTFTSDDASTIDNFIYDSTNDLYKTIDPAVEFGTHYIIIEATSFGTWSGANDTNVQEVGVGKWVVWCDTGTDAVKRAQVHKSLWFGTDGSDQLIDDFTTITRIATSTARDVGKRATYISYNQTTGAGSDVESVGTFADTSTNIDYSSWSALSTDASGTASWEVPDGVVLNSIDASTSNSEMGLDREEDEKDNPADCRVRALRFSNTTFGKAIMLHAGTISWAVTWNVTNDERDFVTDGTLPAAMIAVSGTEWDDSTLIFKSTTTSTVTNVIPVINSQIDATSSEQISVAFDGSTFTDVDNTEIVRATPTGTALWRKIVITRTDLTKIDKVTEQAVKHSFF